MTAHITPPPAIAGRRPVLITGGAGFIGSNLADALAAEGRDVLVYDALLRPGVEANLAWLKERHPQRISAVTADLRDAGSLAAAAAEASSVFHLAAQVAVTTSLTDPAADFAVNLGGTLSLLEALRRRPDPAPLVFASTNKVYGDLADLTFRRVGDAYAPEDPAILAHGVGEDRPLDFHTPYGCSKGGADQYVLDYARSFGVPTCVLRMSCIYGPRQMGTEDQGWVAHFLIRALERERITVYGDGCQVRDVLDVGDAVATYRAALARIGQVKGRAYNLGGGPANAVSLRRVLAAIEGLVGHPLDVGFEEWRAGDQRYYVSDTRRAAADLGLGAPLPWHRGLTRLAEWLAESRGLRLNPRAVPA
ncbi:NAD-dependent epimerase/dehydratase family protein [Methylobacterium sp. 17Sr1-1]|uniref:NAD-dependent epimerase/dehydratase family protein n=1 Tax=Methylobacterium sp. 17Sr1-1 TaxID=2202826 RepID=UPI00194E44E9|nr:NAD-dependent epimerase/dehydratase family protein [Methylobacterium sp. 17Sr1-1]